ncbi:hypothetical protein Hanom_Chr10g00956471 [Helianthus anomalus]
MEKRIIVDLLVVIYLTKELMSISPSHKGTCSVVNELNIQQIIRESFGGKFVYVRLFIPLINERT